MAILFSDLLAYFPMNAVSGDDVAGSLGLTLSLMGADITQDGVKGGALTIRPANDGYAKGRCYTGVGAQRCTVTS